MNTENKIVEQIKKWSQTFGLNCNNQKVIPSNSAFDLSLIQEEFKKTLQAAAENNIKEYQDGLGDVLWVTIRAMLNAGIDPGKTIEAIYISNKSKIDKTNEDALKTKQKYNSQGITTYMRETSEGFITCRASDGKVLKSYMFQEPIF
jgi:NTP pyrophosphatase (non-canonical NTP hydrolase)